MAIGFSASLFGVSSAIILSSMQYLLSRNQNAFLEDVENWLKNKFIESQPEEIINKMVEKELIKESNISSKETMDKLVTIMENQSEMNYKNNKLMEEVLQNYKNK